MNVEVRGETMRCNVKLNRDNFKIGNKKIYEDRYEDGLRFRQFLSNEEVSSIIAMHKHGRNFRPTKQRERFTTRIKYERRIGLYRRIGYESMSVLPSIHHQKHVFYVNIP